MLPKQPNQSLIDGIRCLQGVVSSSVPVGVSVLSKELGLEITRTHRLLRTLSHIGLVRWTPNRKYAPGPGLPVLAAQTLHASGFHKAIPVLEALHQRLDMVVALGVLWNRSVSYLYHAEPGMSLERSIGGFDVWPASLSGLGIALLSKWDSMAVEELYEGRSISGFPDGIDSLKKRLEESAQQNHAFVETHTAEGQHTLAVVVDNDVSMAIGISGKISKGDVSELLPLVQECSKEISKFLEA